MPEWSAMRRISRILPAPHEQDGEGGGDVASERGPLVLGGGSTSTSREQNGTKPLIQLKSESTQVHSANRDSGERVSRQPIEKRR